MILNIVRYKILLIYFYTSVFMSRPPNASDSAIIESYQAWELRGDGSQYKYTIRKELEVSYGVIDRVIESHLNQKILLEYSDDKEVTPLKARAFELISPLIDQLETDFRQREIKLKDSHLKELQRSRENRADLITELEELQQRYDDLEYRYKEKEKTSQENQIELGANSVTINTLKSDIAKANEDLEVKIVEVNELKDEVTVHAQTIFNLHEQHRKERQNDQEKAHHLHHNLRVELQQKQSQVEELNKHCAILVDQSAKTTRENNTLKDQVKRFDVSMTNMNEEAVSLHNKIEVFETSLATIKSEFTEQKHMNQRLESENKHLESELFATEKRLTSTNAMLTQMDAISQKLSLIQAVSLEASSDTNSQSN
jgi:chromosome segregation ATPase